MFSTDFDMTVKQLINYYTLPKFEAALLVVLSGRKPKKTLVPDLERERLHMHIKNLLLTDKRYMTRRFNYLRKVA